ncbi:MAG TPA: cation acetate symporter, partial [Sphingopyxis sp.]|nr:cation acetate symporter [Sphingopyxis sp.]
LLAERLCTVAVVGFAALVAWAFREQQIGFTVSLAFAIAACANFPLLFLSLRWPGLTEAGAFWGGAAGLSAAVILILLGPSVWTDVLGLGDAPFALREPALIAMPLAFVTAFLMSRRR